MVYDLIVVGGGIIGCGIAEWVREDIGRICVVERGGRPKCRASYAAAGGINPHLDGHVPSSVEPMAERSRNLFPGWADRLGAASRTPLKLNRSGLLQLAVEAEEWERLRLKALPHLLEQGIDAELLSGDEARRREPLLGPEVLGALAQPRDMTVEPSKIMRALNRILDEDGRVDRITDTVERLEHERGGVTVHLAGSDRPLRARRLLVAAGHLSSGLLDKYVSTAAFIPVKGQVLEIPNPRATPLSSQCDALLPGDEVIVAAPYAPGRITVGVTFETNVTDARPDKTKNARLLRNLRRVLPALADPPPGRLKDRAGIRPATRDGAPLVGFVDSHHRILAATGHNGLGITLAPRTAQLAAALLLGHDLSEGDRRDLHACNPSRPTLNS